MARSVPEWHGKTDDERVPQKVKIRIWERTGGICHITGSKLRSMHPKDAELEHIEPIWKSAELGKLSGLHREFNMAFALPGAHKIKSKEEAALRATCNAAKATHLRARIGPKSSLRSAPMATTVRAACKRARGHKEPATRVRGLYEDAR